MKGVTVAKSYSDYIKTGQLDPLTAIKMQSVRQLVRDRTNTTLVEFGATDMPADAAAFGMLDALAIKLVAWYGAADAAKVLRHYADVCERQASEVQP